MTLVHVRFRNGSSLEYECDGVSKFNDTLLSLYVDVKKTRYEARLFRPPVAVPHTERQWAVLVPIKDVRFIAPKQVIETPASAIEAAAAGETTEIGSTEGESATRQGDAQTQAPSND